MEEIIHDLVPDILAYSAIGSSRSVTVTIGSAPDVMPYRAHWNERPTKPSDRRNWSQESKLRFASG
jgi:hypothetical protein